MLILRYWRKIIFMKKNRLTKIAYLEELKKERKNSWAKQSRETLKFYGLEKYWKNQLPPVRESKWNCLVENSIKKKEEQAWNSERKKKNAKLETYNNLKEKKKRENILQEMDILAKAITLRIKSGTNFLRIDKGRHLNIKRSDRICQGCNLEIENEEHFLLYCINYKKNKK